MGKVEASEFYEYPGKKVIVKIKVAINIHNPITSGIHVGNPNDGTSWIDFRYEKLPQVCFSCGMFGHGDKLCRNPPLNLETLAPLGPWIRSTQYGKRILEEKDVKYYSNPSHSANFGHYSPPVPTDLLEKLAAMKVNKEDPHPNSNNQSQQNQYRQQYSDYSPMEGILHQQADRSRKAHRLSYHQEPPHENLQNGSNTNDQNANVKRQKLEEELRVGLAKQASPQQ
jgi:hypothetical protein